MTIAMFCLNGLRTSQLRLADSFVHTVFRSCNTGTMGDLIESAKKLAAYKAVDNHIKVTL